MCRITEVIAYLGANLIGADRRFGSAMLAQAGIVVHDVSCRDLPSTVNDRAAWLGSQVRTVQCPSRCVHARSVPSAVRFPLDQSQGDRRLVARS